MSDVFPPTGSYWHFLTNVLYRDPSLALRMTVSGGQPAADGGAAAVAAALADAPYGTVLYDHWYSWHWRYQLFDRRVYVSWFPHARVLLDDLAAFGGSGSARYIALPAGETAAPVVRRLREAGYGLALVVRPPGGSIALWRIRGLTTDDPDFTDFRK